MNEAVRNKRNHGIVIFEDSIKGLSNFIIPFAITLFPAIGSGKLGGVLVTFGLFLAFFGLGIIHSILKWIFETYSIESGIFSIRRGIFLKRNREIPFAKIITFHELQTLTQRVFSAWTIKLDTGNSLNKETEVKLVVSKEDLIRIRELLKPASAADRAKPEDRCSDGSGVVYRSKASHLIRMGLTSNAIFAGLALILSVFQLIPDFLDRHIDEFLGQAERYLRGTPIKATLEVLLLLFAILFIYSAVSLIAAVAATLVKYHDFNVSRDNGNIVIRYGLLRKNSYSIPEDKIYAVYLKQSFLRQMLGYTSVLIESVGYGNEKGEEALLIPLVRLSEVHSHLTDILAGYRPPEPLKTVPKRALRRFLFNTLFYPMLLILPISIFYTYGFISLIIVPFLIISGVLQYRNSGISQHTELLLLGYGGFTRYLAQVRREGIQAVIKKATPFQRAAGLFTLNISIHGTTFGKILSVKHLDNEWFPMLRKLV